MSNEFENKSPGTINTNRYSDSKGTGVLSTLIFAVVVVVIMVAVAYFKGG